MTEPSLPRRPPDRTSDRTKERTAGDPPALKIVPVRHPWRWVASGVILVLLAMLVNTLLFSHVTRGGRREGRYQWGVVGHYLFAPSVLRGIEVTLELTVIAMVAGVVIGIVLAVMRLSPSRLLSGTAWVYIWFFRGTPVLVQLFFWYVGISYLYQHISVGASIDFPFVAVHLPFWRSLVTLNSNTLVTSFIAGALGLSLNEGAYMSEIVRAGIISVDEGQTEAAASLGMSKGLTLRKIVLPQAMRIIIPPTGNETISMLKTTSLVSVIAGVDLFQATQNVSNTNYEVVPLLIVASLWYLFFTSVLTIGQFYVERYYARGASRALPPTPFQRLRAGLHHEQLRPVASITEVPWVAPHD
jgi:polar amino acid transport system permease protein